MLALSYGVLPIYQEKTGSSRSYISAALTYLMEIGRLTRNDRIAYLGGSFGEGHGTTFLEVNTVGDILDNYNNFCLPNLEEAK